MKINKFLFFSMIYMFTTLTNASSVNWEIKFFNEIGQPVGLGEFSYDPETIISFSTESPDPSHIPEIRNINTTFTNLNWKFGGTTLWNTDSASSAWWGGGSLIFTRNGSHFGPFVLGESQAFSGGSRGNSFISLDFNHQTNTDLDATGSWEQTKQPPAKAGGFV